MGIMRKLDEFVGSAMQHDDITCLVVKRTERNVYNMQAEEPMRLMRSN